MPEEGEVENVRDPETMLCSEPLPFLGLTAATEFMYAMYLIG
jgi:hypothetical protein